MEKIYTIPVNDAYTTECDCPICVLKKKSEEDYINYYLGPSLMEPDTRMITNRTGFCPDHMGMLNTREANRLGLGLMIHTHLIDIRQDVTNTLSNCISNKRSLLKGKSNEYKSNLVSLANRIDGRVSLCPICDKIDYSMERYIDVILWLFVHDPDFKQKFANAKSHCLPHIAMLLRGAASKLSQNEAVDFLTILSSSHKKSLDELIADAEWFTLKFDYRNTDKPWGNSKNAIQRSMRFLSSDRSDFDEQAKKRIDRS